MSSHQHQPLTPANPSWTWSGVHGASGTVHPFLAIRDDPDGRYSGLGAEFDQINTILDGSGGLLLIQRSPYQIIDDDDDDDDEIEEVLWSMNIFDEEADDQSDNTSEFDDGDEERHYRLHRLAGLYLGGLYLGAEAESADDQSNNTPEGVQDQASLEVDQHWQTLMVVNPSTHESRVLPPANSRDVGLEFWSYSGVLANLLVDIESQTYRVTLTFPDCVCLYSSTSNAWQCRKFNRRISWGPHNRELLANPWRMEIAKANVNGRLFFADVVVEDSVPIMNLIEIDVEAGSWKLHNWRYSLQTQFMEFVNTPFLRMRGLTDHGMHRALNNRNVPYRGRSRAVENFQIVECMGELYAVIPMSLEEHLPMSLRSRRTLMEVVPEYANFGFSFMPLQFLIVSMRGDGFVHGVLRILLPEDTSSVVGSQVHIDNEYRQNMLMRTLTSTAWAPDFDGFTWRFSCAAEGSVIWVALLDYVLQYDVLTGVSETEIIGASSPEMSLDLCDWLGRIPYRPSEMKP